MECKKNSNLKCNCKCSCRISNNYSHSNYNVINNSCNSNCNAIDTTNLVCNNDGLNRKCNINNESDRSTATTPDLDSCSSSKVSNANSLESQSAKSNGVKSSQFIGVNKVNLFLKKSTSVNSALSKHLEKNQRPNGFLSHISPFNSNLSLSYLTSTFNIFSTDRQ